MQIFLMLTSESWENPLGVRCAKPHRGWQRREAASTGFGQKLAKEAKVRHLSSAKPSSAFIPASWFGVQARLAGASFSAH